MTEPEAPAPQKTEDPPEGPPTVEEAEVIPIADGWDKGYWGVTYAAGDYSVAGVTAEESS